MTAPALTDPHWDRRNPHSAEFARRLAWDFAQVEHVLKVLVRLSEDPSGSVPGTLPDMLHLHQSLCRCEELIRVMTKDLVELSVLAYLSRRDRAEHPREVITMPAERVEDHCVGGPFDYVGCR